MARKDPLASPTLAQLYVQQGHVGRARQVIDTLLEENPLNGHALAMRERLRHVSEASLVAEQDGREIVLRWQKVHAGPTVHLVLFFAWFERAVVRTRVESVACRTSSGEHRVRARPGPGSVVACIGRVEPGHGFVAAAVGEPLAW